MLACFSNPALAGNKDFIVKFDRCGEYVGIGHVPAAKARSLVPSQYALAGDSTNALLVVRVASCAEVSVDGKKSGQARTAQIGVMLNGPDASADINNYLLWFVTDAGNLHGKLQGAGIKNGNDQQLKLVFEPVGGAGTLTIDVDAPRFPAFPMLGSAQAPSSPPQSFVANWYADGNQGALRMQTSFEQLRFGEADLVLTPSPDSELAELIGSPSLSFGVLNSYNEWQTATMQASLQ
jgi:hypothetical protein